MKKIRIETVVFLSQMAERRMDNKIDIDKLQHYTSIVQHISGVSLIEPFKDLSHRLRYVDEEAFDGFPELQSAVRSLKHTINLIEDSRS